MNRSSPLAAVAVIALLALILLAMIGGIGFGVWAHYRNEEHQQREEERHRREEERRKDEIRIKQIDDWERDLKEFEKQYAAIEGATEDEDFRQSVRTNRLNSIRDQNEAVTERNALIRKWPELHRKEQGLRTVK